jgi:homoserine kinase type II
MATFTHLSLDDAQRLAEAHHLSPCQAVIPVAAGTVNSNYFLETSAGRFFVRLYEQQEVEGVAYEWRLLSHLGAEGVLVPPRIEGPAPGAFRVGGRPVAVFAEVRGEDLCQARVSADRVLAVGAALGAAHRAGLRFDIEREGRFRLEDVARLLEQAEAAGRPELAPTIARLRALHAEVGSALAGPYAALPRGVIHGDLFRDNVLWQGERIVALLDWESASHGLLVYDLAVTLLAWCCGDQLDFALGRALVDGYRRERELSELEWQGLWWTMRLGCLRFATTRITDIYLKGTYPAGYKDYRRFLLRLDAVEALTAAQLASTLGRVPQSSGG